MTGYIDDTDRIGDLIIQVFADDSGASDPRDDDNAAEIRGSHRNYTIGDGEPPAEHMRILERGRGLRLLHRYMRRYGDPAADWSPLLAFRGLAMYDHSGVTYWTVEPDSNGHHAFDAAGWDSGLVGYAYVNKVGADMVGTDDAAAALEAEVKEYADWASGNVWAYRIVKPCDHADEHATDELIADCPHAEEIESTYGFIGDPSYAWEEARASAKSYGEPEMYDASQAGAGARMWRDDRATRTARFCRAIVRVLRRPGRMAYRPIRTPRLGCYRTVQLARHCARHAGRSS